MNNIKLFFIISLLSLPMLISAQTSINAVTYMEQLLKSFDDMEGVKWKYLKAVTRGRSARKVEKRRKKLISEYSNALAITRKIKAYQGDTLLKPALISYLKLTKTILKEDYDKILDMEAIAEESYDDMEAYILIQKRTDEKFLEASNLLNAGQSDFAAENNITIVEGEQTKRSERIKKASNALNHYNEVFLIFFKSNIQESTFLNAMVQGNVNAMDQSNNAIATYANEGLEDLGNLKLISNDRTVVNAAKGVLKFYVSETKTDFKEMLNFYIVADEFEAAQKKFEAIKRNKRTKADIDKINKASDDYNKGVNKINTIVQRNNKRRDVVLKAWNKAVSSFFDRNS